MNHSPIARGPRPRWLWFALPALALGTAIAIAPSPRTERDRLEAMMPELRLVVRQKDRSGNVSALYTGQTDPERVAARFEKALNGGGWQSPQRQVGSPFPYWNVYSPWDARPWWSRLPVLDRVTAQELRKRSFVDFRVLEGRAGAKPVGEAWTTVLIREQPGIYGKGFVVAHEVPGPNTSEPVPGWGVRIR